MRTHEEKGGAGLVSSRSCSLFGKHNSTRSCFQAFEVAHVPVETDGETPSHELERDSWPALDHSVGSESSFCDLGLTFLFRWSLQKKTSAWLEGSMSMWPDPWKNC